MFDKIKNTMSAFDKLAKAYGITLNLIDEFENTFDSDYLLIAAWVIDRCCHESIAKYHWRINSKICIYDRPDLFRVPLAQVGQLAIRRLKENMQYVSFDCRSKIESITNGEVPYDFEEAEIRKRFSDLIP